MRLYRFKRTKTSVMGILKDDVGGNYFTLENASTLIPTGVYKVEVNHSPHFRKDLPLVYNESVPASRGIRIHSGNTAKDSKGCICVGNTSSLNNEYVGYSSKALAQLLKNCGKVLEITDIE